MAVIALIEDDPLVRVPLARGLDEAGYKVLVAASGTEGLALLEDHHIDVAVIDVILPGRVDGIGVVQEARRHNPGLKVILTSGRPLPAEQTGIAHFALKPLRLSDLIARVRSVIEGDDDRDMLIRAKQVIDQFGELAMFYAAFRADEWHHYGDPEGCRTWTRISNAVENLQASERPDGPTSH
jgi:DNA-binding response OmpR family regulator